MSDFEDEDDGSNVDDYKRKRINNNLSVKKTREKQKKLVEEATAEVDVYKTENENLKDKYESLKKELNLYKSLFTQRLDNSSLTSTSSTSNDNNNESNKRQKVSSSDNIEPLEKQYTTNIDDLLNLPATPTIIGINEQNPEEEVEEEKANTPLSLLLKDDEYQVNGIISNENIIISKQNSSKDEEEINKKKKDDELETQQTNSRYERKKTIPMPFHHEYAFIEKSIKKK
jgi:hypothetical protein